LTNETSFILIDTGRKNKLNRIVAQTKKLHIDNIDALILTHTHFDHAENASIISKRYEAKIIVHQAEAASLMTGDSLLPEGSIFITKLLISLLGKKLQPLFAYQAAHPDILVKERMNLNEFGFNAFIMHTPGHSPGSISVTIDNEIAIVGDALFGLFRNSVFPPFADDLKQMVLSWGKLLETECTSFLPGHGTEKNRGLLQKQFEKYKARYKL
jgi:glyoxylase-like metal-dependent hydrolase (beta-lactamase superfamily II)